MRLEINDSFLDMKDVYEIKSKARALLIDDNNNLLLSLYDDTYLLPGGTIKRGETISEAIVRELEEELGIIYDIDELSYYGAVTFFQDKYPKENGYTVSRLIHTHYFIGKYKGIDKYMQHLTKKEKDNSFHFELVPLDNIEEVLTNYETNNPRNKYFIREILEVIHAYKNESLKKTLRK